MMMRADLHVHTLHSTRSGNMRFLRSRDCYSRPIDVYRRAKSRGMELVAITDHDSIDGALELAAGVDNPADVIIGEEVSCWYRNIQVHLGVYGMTEALHRDIQPLRGNAFDVIACLRSAGVFFSLNHLLHFYRWQTPLRDYLRLLEEVPALEARNGAMLPAHNLLIEAIVKRMNGTETTLSAIGGSDAHTLRRVGSTWTEAPGRNREEFLDSLKRGLGRPGGRPRERGHCRRRRVRRHPVISWEPRRLRPSRSRRLASSGMPRVWRRVAAVAIHTVRDRAQRETPGSRYRE